MSGCVEAPGGRSKNGYGHATRQGKQQYAHRVAWEDVHGPIPAGLCVCHHCDNPGCINIEHLFLGTHLDNVEDMRRKGRANGPRKLTVEQVQEARARVAGGESQSAVAREFGVHHSTINLIIRGRTWR